MEKAPTVQKIAELLEGVLQAMTFEDLICLIHSSRHLLPPCTCDPGAPPLAGPRDAAAIGLPGSSRLSQRDRNAANRTRVIGTGIAVNETALA